MKIRARYTRHEGQVRLNGEAITFIGGMMLRFVAQTTGHGQYPPERWREFAEENPSTAERYLALHPQS